MVASIEERNHILSLVEAGKVSATQAAQVLDSQLQQRQWLKGSRQSHWRLPLPTLPHLSRLQFTQGDADRQLLIAAIDFDGNSIARVLTQ